MIGVPENLILTNAGNNVEIPEDEYYTTRPEKPTQRASTSEQRSNLKRIHEETSTNINLPDADLDTLPIQWDLAQPMPGLTIEELNQQYKCNAAMAGIKKLIPAQYRQKLTELISTMFHLGKTFKITIDMADSFLESDHWDMFKYEKLMKRTDLRQYLINKASNNDYNVVKKKECQDQEMEKIAGAARIIYDIVLSCKFVPIQYICILAVLMDMCKRPTFICSSMKLPSGHYIDLFLESGSFTTIKEHIIQEIPANSNLSCSIEDQFSRIVMEDQTTGIRQDNIPQISEIQEQLTEQIDPIINGLEGMNAGIPIDQEEIQLGITLQESYDSLPHMSTTKLPQLNEEEYSIQIMEDHGFTIRSDSEDSIEPPEDIPTATLPTEKAIYVNGLTGWKVNNMLKEAFKKFGTIEKTVRTSHRAAIIRFEQPTQAARAIAEMNGTIFMEKTISVTKAKEEKTQDKNQSDDQTDTNEGTSTSFTIIHDDQSIWEELGQDTKDFDIDIKPFAIEDQINPAIQERAQIHHQPYDWNDSIDQEIIDIEQNYNEDSSLVKSDSITSLESKTKDKENISTASKETDETTPVTPYSPIQVQLPPISPTSSTSCHGFESPTSYSPNYSSKQCLDQRLEAYNDHAWDIVIMEHVIIPPNKIAKFLIRVTSEFNPNIRYSLRNQNTFVLTSSLTPFPQINDGVFETEEK